MPSRDGAADGRLSQGQGLGWEERGWVGLSNTIALVVKPDIFTRLYH